MSESENAQEVLLCFVQNREKLSYYSSGPSESRATKAGDIKGAAACPPDLLADVGEPENAQRAPEVAPHGRHTAQANLSALYTWRDDANNQDTERAERTEENEESSQAVKAERQTKEDVELTLKALGFSTESPSSPCRK